MNSIYNKINISVKYKIVLIAIIISLIPMLTSSYISIYSSKKILSDNIKKELEEKSFLVGEGIDRLIYQRLLDIKIISQADVLEKDNSNAIIKYIKEITKESEYIQSVYILEKNGKINLSSLTENEKDKDKSLNDLPPSIKNLFIKSLEAKQGEVFVSEAIMIENELSLAFLTPVTDDTNKHVIKVLMITMNLKSITKIISNFSDKIIGTRYIYIVDDNGFIILSNDKSIKGYEKTTKHNKIPLLNTFLKMNNEVGNLKYTDMHGDSVIAVFSNMKRFGKTKSLNWTIIAVSPEGKVLSPAYELSKNLIYITICILLFMIIISFYIGSYISKIIIKYSNITKEVAKGNLNIVIDNIRNDELGILQSSMNDIIQNSIKIQEQADSISKGDFSNKIKLRSKDDNLGKALINMSKSLSLLKITQNQLQESEKMASLGRLVSGVAHEVNTPLGNALTGVSLIEIEANNLKKHLQNNTLKKSILDKTVQTLSEASRLVLKSISSAVTLISNFKQISADQTSNHIRVFDVAEYVEEIFSTFHNKLKKLPIEVEIISNKKVEINSNPGVFSQIISNLISNALLHAFNTDYKNAKITITINENEENIFIVFEDNGFGMSAAVRDIAFEPFVTTKRNSGGTGLGLSIIYNIIHQKLDGHIKLLSSEGAGSRFEMTIPKKNR